MAPPLLALQNIQLSFGGTPLLEGVDLSVFEKDRVCLVGRNGCGKSTLLKVAAGQIQTDGGERFLQPGVTLRYLPQEPDLAGYASVQAYVEDGLEAGDDPYRAAYLLDCLGVPGSADPATLSGGEARRAALARVMAPDPDILLLDEPTNHLDLPAIEWLEGELSRLKSALVIISHDRRFLENLSRKTLWIDRGQSKQLDKGFAHFEAWRDDVLAQEELEQHKLARKIVREEHWLTYGVTARRKRNQKRLGQLHDLRRRHREHRQATGNVKFGTANGEASGRLVLEAKDLCKTFGSRVIVSGLSLRLQRGDRLGLTGPNGSGKTTLINLLTGSLEPDAGSVRFGANLQIVTLDQRRESLDPETTLGDALTGGRGDMVTVGDKPRHVVGYMKDFLFQPEQVRSPLRVLSGGERGRLMLARALAKPSNFLVLDEPTNDLDLQTLDLLQELLADYKGTVLLVSHDRDFLDRIVTSTLAYEGEEKPGLWREYAGGYSDMLAQRRTGADTEQGRASSSRTGPPPSRTASDRTDRGPQRKLSFKDKHALETLPEKIAALEAEIAELQSRLAEPEFYTRDREAFEAAAQALKASQDGLSQAEEQWLQLEMKRETLEG
ncbi:MAG: ABC-F family ATP-binding cassette domain-containing protein [Hyphomicrobiaceae bacterium]